MELIAQKNGATKPRVNQIAAAKQFINLQNN